MVPSPNGRAEGQSAPAKRNGNRGKGRPSLCTPDTMEKIIGAIKCGISIERACALGGISESTYFNWRERAHEARAASANGITPSASELPYLQFLEGVEQAHREGEHELAATLKRASEPRRVRVTTVRRVILKDGNRIVRNDAGEPIFVDETTITEHEEYDWKAAQAILRARHRRDWSEQTNIELTGANGGPLIMEMPVQNADAQALADLEAAYREAGILPQPSEPSAAD